MSTPRFLAVFYPASDTYSEEVAAKLNSEPATRLTADEIAGHCAAWGMTAVVCNRPGNAVAWVNDRGVVGWERHGVAR